MDKFRVGRITVHRIEEWQGPMFVGDVVHHPAQIYNPEWNSLYCEDQEQARASRRTVLIEAADTGALFVPAHFGGAHVVRIARERSAFKPIYVRSG